MASQWDSQVRGKISTKAIIVLLAMGAMAKMTRIVLHSLDRIHGDFRSVEENVGFDGPLLLGLFELYVRAVMVFSK